MIVLPVCCLDIRETPLKPLSITYETDFMAAPQEQVLELRGRPPNCEDCSIVWVVSQGPGILEPEYGPKVTLSITRKQIGWRRTTWAKSKINLYCMDQLLQTIELWSQFWAYRIWEKTVIDFWELVPRTPGGTPVCMWFINLITNYYDCHGNVVKTDRETLFARHEGVTTPEKCELLGEEAKERVFKYATEKLGRLWKVPIYYTVEDVKALGYKGYCGK